MKIEKYPGFVTGIKCDMCGSDHEDDFVYYSMDFREVKVQDNRPVTGMKSIPVTFSLDACQECVAKLSEAVRAHYAATSQGVNCDLCGQKLRGTFSYWYCSLSEVTVQMRKGRVECVRCKTPQAVAQKSCKCGSSSFVRVAVTRVDDIYLQIAACQRDYDSLANMASELRHRVSAGAVSEAEPEAQ